MMKLKLAPETNTNLFLYAAFIFSQMEPLKVVSWISDNIFGHNPILIKFLF